MSDNKKPTIIFDTEVILETIKADIVAIGDGFAVTAQAILDDEDVLCAFTVARPEATFDEASGEMLSEAVAQITAFTRSGGHEPTREAEARALEAAANRYPAMLRDMVSRGSVQAWLRAEAQRIREGGAS